jgi:hypothetical protein
MTENNTEQAIQLFFDSPDLASSIAQGSQAAAPSIPTPTPPQRSARVGRQDEHGVVHLDSEDDDMDIDDHDAQATSRAEAVGGAADYEDDEAIARRLQEELYTGGDASGYDADGVRAPMARTTETLVGGHDGDWRPDDMNAAILQQMRSRQQARTAGMIFNEGLNLFSMLIFVQDGQESSTNEPFLLYGTNHQMLPHVVKVLRRLLGEHQNHQLKLHALPNSSDRLSSS